MHPEEERTIQNNLVALAKVFEFEKIKEVLSAKRVVEESKIQFIASQVSSQSKEVLLLYEILKSNSPTAFIDFITILQENGLNEALKILGFPARAPKYRQTNLNKTLATLTLGDSSSSDPKFCMGMTSGKYESPNVVDRSARYDDFTLISTQIREQHYPHHSSPLKHISHETLKTHNTDTECGFKPKNPDIQQVNYANNRQNCDNMLPTSKFGLDDGHLASFLAQKRELASKEAEKSSLSQQQQHQQQQQRQTPDTTQNLRVAGGQLQQQARSGNTRASMARVPPERAAQIQQKIQDLSFSNDERSNDHNIIYTTNSSTNTTNNNSNRHHSHHDRDIVSTNSDNILEFHPYETDIPISSSSSREIDCNNMNSSSAPTPAGRYHTSIPGFESDASSAGSVISAIDPNQNVTSEISHYPELLNIMEVRLATELRYDKTDDYKMTAKPRGPCLIINNVDFEGDIFPTRRGSDNDARRFDTIFKQLGFEVSVRRNLTADMMRKELKNLSKSCKKEHDSVFIFIFSHGNETGIYGTDGYEVITENIISWFDNRNCKAMIGKPKVFVIQACRGMTKDNGGFNSGSSMCGDEDSTDARVWSSVVSNQPGSSAESGAPPPLEPLRESQRKHQLQLRDPNQADQFDRQVPTSWLPSTLSSFSSSSMELRKQKHPIRTDMAIIFSCLAGYVSVRNETAGSWLGVALAHFIMIHAHERDLIRILNLVTNDVIKQESSHGYIQSIELKLLGWSKNLFFNPGKYE